MTTLGTVLMGVLILALAGTMVAGAIIFVSGLMSDALNMDKPAMIIFGVFLMVVGASGFVLLFILT